MSSTYSTNLALELIGTGDQAGVWGNTTNTNLGTLIEQAISGYVTQAVSTGTDTTITIPNGATGVARNMYIELTGTGGASTNLIVPSNKKLYFIFNNTASGQVTVKVSGQTGVSVPNKAKMVLVSNGTDIVDATNYLANLSAASANITVLTSASATITNLLATSLTVSSGSTLNGGVVINEPGADADTRIEGDTDANLLFVDASTDRIGVGTNAPLAKFQVGNGTATTEIRIDADGGSGNGGFIRGYKDTSNASWYFGDLNPIAGGANAGLCAYVYGTDPFVVYTNGTERARIDSSGNLLVGTTTQYGSQKLSLNGGIAIDGRNASTPGLSEKSDDNTGIFWPAADALGFSTAGTERARITSDGNLAIGKTSTSYKLGIAVSASATNQLAFEATNANNASCEILLKTDVATINAGGSGNLAFANGAGVTERARITSGGTLLVGQTTDNSDNAGSGFDTTGFAFHTKSGGFPLLINRLADDGTLILFRQASVDEGSISVSGNTVSYNSFAGSHWSQLKDGSKPDILRGTVLESINELCVWPGEQNEQLPKCKISDTAGSKKVYGVFMAWDNDWTATNDMYVTAVGAFICRVNGSVTVEEGDLLESNGDGTARVQADDIIRSSTIGKVTSTFKTHQYDDGSYCVPTVLYCG